MLAQEYQARMKTTHIKSHSTMNKYYDLYTEALENGEKPGIIVRISKEANICPCLVAKLILQKFFSRYDDPQKSPNTLNVSQYLRDTSLIEDKDLSYEVYLVCNVFY